MTTGMTTLGEYQPVNETIAIGGRCSDNKAAELCGQLESDDNVAVVSDDDSVLDPDYNIHDVDDSLMDDTDCSEGEQNADSSKYGTKKSKRANPSRVLCHMMQGHRCRLFQKEKLNKDVNNHMTSGTTAYFAAKRLEVNYPGTFSPIRRREKLLKLPCFLKSVMRE